MAPARKYGPGRNFLRVRHVRAHRLHPSTGRALCSGALSGEKSGHTLTFPTFQVPQFVPPSGGPLVASSNYVGSSNGSLPKTEVVSGKSFNRFIQVSLDSRRA